MSGPERNNGTQTGLPRAEQRYAAMAPMVIANRMDRERGTTRPDAVQQWAFQPNGGVLPKMYPVGYEPRPYTFPPPKPSEAVTKPVEVPITPTSETDTAAVVVEPVHVAARGVTAAMRPIADYFYLGA